MSAKLKCQKVATIDLFKFQSINPKVESVVRTLVALNGWSKLKAALWRYLLGSEVRNLDVQTVWELEAIYHRWPG